MCEFILPILLLNVFVCLVTLVKICELVLKTPGIQTTCSGYNEKFCANFA
jgi:hypothetical protein